MLLGGAIGAALEAAGAAVRAVAVGTIDGASAVGAAAEEAGGASAAETAAGEAGGALVRAGAVGLAHRSSTAGTAADGTDAAVAAEEPDCAEDAPTDESSAGAGIFSVWTTAWTASAVAEEPDSAASGEAGTDSTADLTNEGAVVINSTAALSEGAPASTAFDEAAST